MNRALRASHIPAFRRDLLATRARRSRAAATTGHTEVPMLTHLSIVPASLRARAAARVAVLRTRLGLMALVHAMTDHEFACLCHQSALQERASRARRLQDRVAELNAELIKVRAALMHASDVGFIDEPAGARIDQLSSDVAFLEAEVRRAEREREEELEQLNNRIVGLDAGRQNSAARLSDAMRAAGTRSADLIELVQLSGVPEAAEILSSASVAQRRARAGTLLDAMQIEARRAEDELEAIGSSRAFDAALLEQIDAEEAHTIARRSHEEAAARARDAFRSLTHAQRRVSEALRMAAAGSGPGDQHRESPLRGTGEPGSTDHRELAPDAAPDGAGDPQQPSGSAGAREPIGGVRPPAADSISAPAGYLFGGMRPKLSDAPEVARS